MNGMDLICTNVSSLQVCEPRDDVVSSIEEDFEKFLNTLKLPVRTEPSHVDYANYAVIDFVVTKLRVFIRTEEGFMKFDVFEDNIIHTVLKRIVRDFYENYVKKLVIWYTDTWFGSYEWTIVNCEYHDPSEVEEAVRMNGFSLFLPLKALRRLMWKYRRFFEIVERAKRIVGEVERERKKEVELVMPRFRFRELFF